MQKTTKSYLFLTSIILLFFSIILAVFSHSKPSSREKTSKSDSSISKESQTIATSTDKVELLLSQMSLEEKVGQLFFARVPDTTAISDIQTYHLGGYILFGKNFQGQTLDSVKNTIKSFQAASTIPMLIGSDEEGGQVSRISQVLNTPFQSPAQIYKTGGLQAIQEDTQTKAKLLKSLGIQAGLFPVADLATDPMSLS